MKRTALLVILILTFHFRGISQTQTITVNGKSYDCTKVITYGLVPNHVELIFIKDGTKGMVFFKGTARVTGTISLYLDDKTTIKLMDINKFDYFNDEYLTLYKLSAAEVEKLKSKNISSIRIPKFVYNDGSVGTTKIIYGTYQMYYDGQNHTVTENTIKHFVKLFQ